MGRDFGASYIDSECFGGRLYDLDDCDEPGTLNEPMDFIACPECNHAVWLESMKEEILNDGAVAFCDGKRRGDNPFIAAKLRYPGDRWQLAAWWWQGWNEALAATEGGV